jgi:integrase
LTEKAKNLTEVEPSNDGLAGATVDVKSLLAQFPWWLKKEGYAEATIETNTKILRILSKRGADLRDPESVKDKIACQEWSNKRKSNAVYAYASFLHMSGGTWNPPRYRTVSKDPFIPFESEIDSLIAGCSPRVSVFLRLMKETAVRCGEAGHLCWSDIDFESKVVRVTPEKGSNPRTLNISNSLIAALNTMPRSSERVFSCGSIAYLRRTFERQRKKLVQKLGNPRLGAITFHTFRHWKATTLYRETLDPIYVQRFLGHKRYENTDHYIQIAKALFADRDEGFICKVASNIEEAQTLIEAGFEYICDFNQAKMFRKRK